MWEIYRFKDITPRKKRKQRKIGEDEETNKTKSLAETYDEQEASIEAYDE